MAHVLVATLEENGGIKLHGLQPFGSADLYVLKSQEAG